MVRQQTKLWSIVVLVLALGIVFGSVGAVYAAPPTLSTASYDVSTGKLTLTGSNLVSIDGKVSNDIDPTKIIISNGVSNQVTLSASTKKAELNEAKSGVEVVLGTNDRKVVEAWMKDNVAADASGNTFKVAVLAGWNGSSSKGDLVGQKLAVTGFAAAQLTSATYDVATGKLTLTATGLAEVKDKYGVANTPAIPNDIDPTKIILSDGVSNQMILGSSTKKVELGAGNTTTAEITLGTNDRKVFETWINKNGDYKIAVLPGWNGPTSKGDVAAKTMTVSNYAAPVATMVTTADSSVVVGKTVSAKSSKTGFIYLVTAVTDPSTADKAALDALVTDKKAAKAAVSKADTAVSIIAKDLPLGDYKVIAVDTAGVLSALSTDKITLVNAPAPALTATAAAGTASGTTKVTATAGTGNHLVVKVASATIATPRIGDAVPTGTGVTNPYTSTSNISGVDSTTNKYLGVYEADASDKVVKFKLVLLSSTTINLSPSQLSVEVAPGSAEGTTKITATAGSGNHLVVKISSTTITTPKIGTAVPTGTDVTSTYSSGSDITGVSATAKKYVAVYEADSSNKVVKFALVTLAADDIKTSDVTKPTLSNVGTAVETPNTLAATSSEAGTLYLVLKSEGANYNNFAAKADLDNAVTAGKGSKVAATAATPADIPTTGLTAGTYVVYAVDAAGNVSTASADVTVTNPDITAPTLSAVGTSVVTPNTLAATSSEDGTVYLVLKSEGANYNNFAAQTDLENAVTAGKGSKVTATAATPADIPTTGLTAGTYVVYAADAAGNVSSASADVTVTNP